MKPTKKEMREIKARVDALTERINSFMNDEVEKPGGITVVMCVLFKHLDTIANLNKGWNAAVLDVAMGRIEQWNEAAK